MRVFQRHCRTPTLKKSLLRFMLDFMTFQHPMLKLYKVQLR